MSSEGQKFVLDSGWQILLQDLGVSPQDLLRQAHLPLDLFSQPSPTLTAAEYFQYWRGLETLVPKPTCDCARFRVASPRIA